LESGPALKVALTELDDSKENVRSALNRDTQSKAECRDRRGQRLNFTFGNVTD